MDNFTWTLRVRTRGDGRATVYVRQHQFDVGAPLHFDEQYDRVTALEYALGALGADIVNGLAARCRKQRLDVDHVEALVGGALNNPLTYLDVVGEEGHPGLERITIRVYVSSLETQAAVQRVWQEMLARSPLARTFAAAVTLDVALIVAP